MDCHNDDDSTAVWEWQGEDYSLQKDSDPADMSRCLWNGASQNEEDVSYMLDEATPIKACGDLAYHVNGSVNTNKELQQVRETTSQAKRRRTLQFNDEVLDTPLCNEMSSVFLKSKETSLSSYEGLDHSSDGWLADCFNDSDVHRSLDDMNLSGASNVQIHISGLCNKPPERGHTMAPNRPTQTCKNVVFKGRKSYVQAPIKLASSVAYPFAFVKPCGAYGDVTLKDINQRLHNPLKSKQLNEDPSASYPTSAFSGKPVVGKTKIRTEGGKGSITIMRTKG
ncbi:hypothetical protein NMG60_11034515 [Bertholletia excelsa]